MPTVTVTPLLAPTILWLLVTSVASAKGLSLVVSPNATLQVYPGCAVENSPGTKPGSKVLCERVEIHGLSRLMHLKKFANSIKVKVSYKKPTSHVPNIQVCFHSNMTLEMGMCHQSQWEKLSKGLWIRSMSPFDQKLLDIRLAGSAAEPLEVSLFEEFYLHRVVFLVLGTLLMTSASFLSESLVFYYGGAMAMGVLLITLFIIYQGMRLLPTSRRSSFALFVYSSIVGLGSFLLSYVPKLLQSILAEFGIGEDMYYPLGVFSVIFLVIAGAWSGFLAVRKLVLTDEGEVDVGVSRFVAWSIRFVALSLVLQSSLDPLMAAMALLCGIVVSSVFKRSARFIYRLKRRVRRYARSKLKTLRNAYDSPVQERHIHKPSTGGSDSKVFQNNSLEVQGYDSPIRGLDNPRPSPRAALTSTRDSGSASNSASERLDSERFYSSFHTTPERRNFSKDEWDTVTETYTKKAMKELVSSPKFGEWVVDNADRITLAREEDDAELVQGSWKSWFR